jgi:acyl-CoA thioester hydrolase
MDDLWSAPVRYVECDGQGVVFNGHFLTYADEAVSNWYIACGTPWSTVLDRGMDAHLKSTTLTWDAPVRLGDTIHADVTCLRVGSSSSTLQIRLRVGEQICCTVDTTYVFVGEDRRPSPIPADLKEIWSKSG